MRIALARLANTIGQASNRLGAPGLSADSTRETLISWLEWCDPNGTYADPVKGCTCEDDACERSHRTGDDDFDPLTVESAWELIDGMISEDAVFFEPSGGMLDTGWYVYNPEGRHAGPFDSKDEAINAAERYV